MEQWVREPGALGQDPQFRSRLSMALAALVRDLHGRGLIHRDLYLSHIFLEVENKTSPKLCLIDLQRMLRPRVRWRRWVVKDLAALHYSIPAGAASVTDRVRWYKHYCGHRHLTKWDRGVLRAVVAKAARIAHHSTKHRMG